MAAKSTHWRAWSRTYSLDKRQARRLRRRVSKSPIYGPGEVPCPVRGCALLGNRPHVIHFKRGFGPFAERSR